MVDPMDWICKCQPLQLSTRDMAPKRPDFSDRMIWVPRQSGGNETRQGVIQLKTWLYLIYSSSLIFFLVFFPFGKTTIGGEREKGGRLILREFQRRVFEIFERRGLGAAFMGQGFCRVVKSGPHERGMHGACIGCNKIEPEKWNILMVK